jgi:cell division protein FtsB
LQIPNPVRRVIFWGVLMLAGLVGYRALRGPDGIPALREKWSEIRDMEEQNAAIQRENDYRRDRIKKLESDSTEQELEIRKKLKLLRPGETSFILPAAPGKTEPPHDGSAAPSQPPAGN